MATIVSKILLDALSSYPDNPKYKTPDGFTRWGLVEKDINKAFSELEQKLADAESRWAEWKDTPVGKVFENHLNLEKRLEEAEKKILEQKQINQSEALLNTSLFRENNELRRKLEGSLGVVNFYADPQSWSRYSDLLYNSISVTDCADYPHFTRDVRLTGGAYARAFLEKEDSQGDYSWRPFKKK